MGQITSSVGLVSGIDYGALVDQLIALEERPKQLVQSRITVLNSQQVALQEINSRLLSLKLSAKSFTDSKVFKTTSVASTNESVLKATASSTAIPGAYDFVVSRLVTSQQVITRGFADNSNTPVAPTGGTFTFESAAAKLSTDTNLSQLNGGAGVARGKIRITDRSGASAVVDLSRALTVNDVLNAVNGADGVNVTASVEGDRIKLVDNTGSTTTSLAVAEVNAGTTAASLGLNVASVGDTLSGAVINTIGDATSLSALNDGNGVRTRTAQSDIQIATRDGATFNIDLSAATSIGDVIELINTASAGSVTAAVNAAGTGLQLTDNTAGGTTFAVTALNSSNAALDLGILTTDGDADGVITGSRVIAGLNSKLIKNLNGGSGAGLGTIHVDNRAGVATDIDLSTASSIADVISLINSSGAGVTASLNTSGNGIKITDTTGAAASNLTISDVSGTSAADLNIAQDVAASKIESGNLQFKYVSQATLLANLNGGRGVTAGKFIITDSGGASATVDLTQGDETTIASVISEINSRGLALTARVNDTGDGLLIEDTGPGTLAIKIEEAGSTTARDLGILGEAANPGDAINGSFEKTVTIDAADTLDDIVTKINDAGASITATIVNDGSGVNPYRLSLSSQITGRAGAFILDDGGLGFNATTLSEAKDAVVFFGSGDPAKGIAITSKTNSLTSVVPGVTIDLKGASNSPAQVVVTKDTSTIVKSVQKFVDDFNTAIAAIKKHDSYDTETETRGLLLGDSTVGRVRSLLYDIVNRRNTDLTGQYNSLTQIGVKVVAGAQLEFDQAKFATALANDPAAVEALFTFKETTTNEDGDTVTSKAGIGVRIDELLDRVTNSSNGIMQARIDAINTEVESNNKRIDDLDKRLAAKRERLTAQFIAMERTLSQLQSQSGALASFQSAAATTSASKSTG